MNNKTIKKNIGEGFGFLSGGLKRSRGDVGAS
jgi:hypothetical protein